MRKPRFPLVKQVYNLEDYCHHAIQVIVVGSFKDSEGLFGKYEKGRRRSACVVVRKGVGIRMSGVATFKGGRAAVICTPDQ